MELDAGKRGTLRLRVPRRARRYGAKILRNRGRVVAQATVAATDADDNRTTRKRTVRFKPVRR